MSTRTYHHQYAGMLLRDLTRLQQQAQVLADASGSVEAAKAATRLALSIDDITTLREQLAPAPSAETVALREAVDSLRAFTPER